MPRVARIGPYRFFFYSREGSEPAHIHVESGRAEAKVWLADCSLARSFGFREHELNTILELVGQELALFRTAWERHFGTD